MRLSYFNHRYKRIVLTFHVHDILRCNTFSTPCIRMNPESIEAPLTILVATICHIVFLIIFWIIEVVNQNHPCRKASPESLRVSLDLF